MRPVIVQKFRRRDLPLISCLVYGLLYPRTLFERIYPKRLLGFIRDGKKCFFYLTNFSRFRIPKGSLRFAQNIIIFGVHNI